MKTKIKQLKYMTKEEENLLKAVIKEMIEKHVTPYINEDAQPQYSFDIDDAFDFCKERIDEIERKEFINKHGLGERDLMNDI